MNGILLLLFWFLLGSTVVAKEPRALNTADTRRLAQRAVEWLVKDEWGTPDKQYSHPGLSKGPDRWRSWLTRRKPEAVAITVYFEDRPSDHFLYKPVSREISDPPPPTDSYSIGIHISPHRDAGWRVRVSAGQWFYIQVTEQDDTFVVRRHEDTWTID